MGSGRVMHGDTIETQTFGELKAEGFGLVEPKRGGFTYIYPYQPKGKLIMTPLEIRQETLDLAKQYTSKDRNSAYGEPEDNFNNIAALWNAYAYAKYNENVRDTDWGFDATDVAIMNILLKVARLATNPSHKDSWIDIAGYAACGAGIALKDK